MIDSQLLKDLIELNNKYLELKERTEWILCDDNMPELNTLVLVLINGKNPDIDSLIKDGSIVVWNAYEFANVTHWMPIPEPPKE